MLPSTKTRTSELPGRSSGRSGPQGCPGWKECSVKTPEMSWSRSSDLIFRGFFRSFPLVGSEWRGCQCRVNENRPRRCQLRETKKGKLQLHSLNLNILLAWDTNNMTIKNNFYMHLVCTEPYNWVHILFDFIPFCIPPKWRWSFLAYWLRCPHICLLSCHHIRLYPP